MDGAALEFARTGTLSLLEDIPATLTLTKRSVLGVPRGHSSVNRTDGLVLTPRGEIGV